MQVNKSSTAGARTQFEAVQQGDGTWSIVGLTFEQVSVLTAGPQLLEMAKGMLLHFRKLTGSGAIDLNSCHWGMAATYRDLLAEAVTEAEDRDSNTTATGARLAYLVEISDVKAGTKYIAAYETECNDATDKSVYREVLESGEVVTMGSVIGRAITGRKNAASTPTECPTCGLLHDPAKTRCTMPNIACSACGGDKFIGSTNDGDYRHCPVCSIGDFIQV